MRTDVREFNRFKHRAPRVVQGSPHRAYDLIRSGIRTGLFTGEAALVEESLMRTLSASRNAVRQALQMLASEGIVDRRPNLGTTVVAALADIEVTEIVQQWDANAVEVVEVDHRQVPANNYIRSRLGLEDGMTVDVCELLISVRSIPHSLRVSYVPTCYGPITRVMEPIPVSVAFEQVFGYPMSRQESTIGAHAAGLSTARMLGINEGAPILLQETVTYDSRDLARELSYVHHRADRVTISVGTVSPGSVSASSVPADSGHGLDEREVDEIAV